MNSKKHTLLKKLMAILLAVALFLPYMPTISFAADESLSPEPSYIVVQKTITGLTDEQVKTLKNELTITVAGGGKSYTLEYNQNEGNIQFRETDNTWAWRISGATGGTYTVSESGCEPTELGLPAGAKLTPTGFGDVTVASADINVYADKETTCRHVDWPLYEGKFFAGSLTGGNGVVVITNRAPSASQRTAIEAALIGGNWKAPVYYYSLSNLNIDEGNNNPDYAIPIKVMNENSEVTTLTYYPNRTYSGESASGVIEFSDTSVWNHVAAVTYDTEAVKLADIQTTNAYTQPVVLENALKISKTLTGREWKDTDEFSFTISGENTTTPMPSQKKVTISGTNIDKTAEFGSISYNEPGTYTYTIKEDPISSDSDVLWDTSTYTVTVTVEQGNDGVLKISSVEYKKGDSSFDYDANSAPMSFTNIQKIDIPVEKVWNDSNNQDGKRPTSVTVKLLANGAETGKSLTLNAGNSWKESFVGLAKTDENGSPITYTVKEEGVSDYTSQVASNESGGFTITNTYTPETVTVAGSKTWEDNDNQDGKRPQSITINLLADGQIKESKNVTESDGWQWSFDNLPKYKNGEEIIYSITEDAVEGYSTDYSGYNVTNRYTPGKTSVTVSKSWEDGNNQDGKRPDSVTVKLLANGVDTQKTLDLSAANNWTGSFADLDEYKDGQKIQYTVQEVVIEGYSSETSGDASNGFTITNTYTPETINIPVKKEWNHGDNPADKQPTAVTVELYADGTKTSESLTLNAGNDWKASFENLPKYKNGNEIQYKVEEVPVDSYGSVVTGDKTDGFIVTNTYEKAVYITPADIIVYTGGDEYAGVVDNGHEIAPISNGGLPTPGYLITLPEDIDKDYFGDAGVAADLSGRVQFVYDFNGDGQYVSPDDRVWKLSLYSEGGDMTSQTSPEDGRARFVYRMENDSVTGTPLRMQFTDEDENVTTSDDFTIRADDLYQEFKMSIYRGTLDRGKIKAEILNEEGTVVATRNVEVGTATLTIRGTTNSEEFSSVVHEESAVSNNKNNITALVPEDAKYVINQSQVSVAPANVSLLSDAVVDTSILKEYIVNKNIADNDENFEYRYLDLVDTTNGNAYVTADKPIDVYWKLPEGASSDDNFRIVHFKGLDRQYDNATEDLIGTEGYEVEEYSAAKKNLSIVTINDVEYLKFSVDSFSPFVLAWSENEDDSNTPSVTPSVPDGDDTPDLNTEDHFSYIVGYPEDYRTGEPTDDEDLWPVKPQGNITRAEVATIFYRLLTDEARTENWTQDNSFTDVDKDDWFNTPVSTLSAMGIISGYEDGSFQPNAPITRAEFAAIAVRFFEEDSVIYEEGTFNDVVGGEWFANAVQAAKEHGIIGGYPDGSFQPNKSISRAEACSIVNRTLDRIPDEDHLLPVEEMNNWPDNLEGAWYYADMQEATNGHEYEWITDDGKTVEDWTGELPEIDWDEVEREQCALHGVPYND